MSLISAILTASGAVLAPPATAVDSPIGRLGDTYEPRNSDAPDALQATSLNMPTGATASDGVWWDCYRDLVSNVVLVDKKTGFHLAQWNA